jgi:hypothetical protein
VSGKSGLTAVDRFRRPTRSSNYGKVVQLAVLPLQSRATETGSLTRFVVVYHAHFRLFDRLSKGRFAPSEDDWGIQQVI